MSNNNENPDWDDDLNSLAKPVTSSSSASKGDPVDEDYIKDEDEEDDEYEEDDYEDDKPSSKNDSSSSLKYTFTAAAFIVVFAATIGAVGLGVMSLKADKGNYDQSNTSPGSLPPELTEVEEVTDLKTQIINPGEVKEIALEGSYDLNTKPLELSTEVIGKAEADPSIEAAQMLMDVAATQLDISGVPLAQSQSVFTPEDIEEIISKSIDSYRSTVEDESEQLLATITSLTKQVNALSKGLDNKDTDHIEKNKKLTLELKNLREFKLNSERLTREKLSKEAKEAESFEIKASADKARIAKIKESRTRINGFKVINKTKDGEMSVVKTPNGRVNVYFKGERFSAAGHGSLVVSGIDDNGSLILVGDKLFIDEELAVWKKPKVTKPASDKKEHVKKHTSSTARKIAAGWEVSGYMAGSYLIKKPDGGWINAATNEHLPGLGVIKGKDGRDLLVGNSWIIKSSKGLN